MGSPKHLVLDEDVHRALRKRKAETGLNVKVIGNCALRSALEGPLLCEAIGKLLVESGKVTEAEFAEIHDAAMHEICGEARRVGSLVRPTDHDTLTTGSWEIRELVLDEQENYQVVEAWVKDRRLRPITLHRHEGDEYLVLLSGAIMATIDLETVIVKAPDNLLIPGGAFHSVTPLAKETRLVGVLSPPELGYHA